ncbi:lipoprotein [Frigidibacter sp.]|nr:lipoprotein [Frigidibacter sp.]MDP3340345.1 lipoprotein [Frigidibacter sp.]
MKRIALLALLMAGLSGCNTVAGLGEDVSDSARTVQGMM